VADAGEIAKIVDLVVAENPEKAEQAKEKPALLGWFVGQAMRASGGKANPQAVSAALKAKLGLE
jgi:aspartyl-tRNA(Asn)/glutamyl-tRNA(Gln) amidotransferase subunit B